MTIFVYCTMINAASHWIKIINPVLHWIKIKSWIRLEGQVTSSLTIHVLNGPLTSHHHYYSSVDVSWCDGMKMRHLMWCDVNWCSTTLNVWNMLQHVQNCFLWVKLSFNFIKNVLTLFVWCFYSNYTQFLIWCRIPHSWKSS